MIELGGRDQGSVGRRLRGPFGVIAGAVALALAFGVPNIGDDQRAEAEATPAPAVRTVVATEAQVAASNMPSTAAISAVGKKPFMKPVTIESRITDSEAPIMTEEGKGNYVRLVCPNGAIAVSGGMVTKYINLLMSASGPNDPITGKYTPRTWWVTVTNANVDGQGGTYAWRGVVNCMFPVKIKS
jgi:hypothetical protein